MGKEGSDDIYMVNKEIAHREIENQILFLRPDDHFLYTLNKTGKFIWGQILQKKPVAKIVKKFAKRFSISDEKANKDVLKFIKELEKKKVILKKTN